MDMHQMFARSYSWLSHRLCFLGVVISYDVEYNIINGGGELKITKFLGQMVIS